MEAANDQPAEPSCGPGDGDGSRMGAEIGAGCRGRQKNTLRLSDRRVFVISRMRLLTWSAIS